MVLILCYSFGYHVTLSMSCMTYFCHRMHHPHAADMKPETVITLHVADTLVAAKVPLRQRTSTAQAQETTLPCLAQLVAGDLDTAAEALDHLSFISRNSQNWQHTIRPL
jgi:hypothetical protein